MNASARARTRCRVLAALDHQQQVIGGLVDRVDRMESTVVGDRGGSPDATATNARATTLEVYR